MDQNTKECHICNSRMKFHGYNGDWEEWKCKNNECNGTIKSPVGSTNNSGFTMESLGNISDFVEDT